MSNQSGNSTLQKKRKEMDVGHYFLCEIFAGKKFIKEKRKKKMEKRICKYGASCYRKNEQHFLEFDHPWMEIKKRKREDSSSPKMSEKKPTFSGATTIEGEGYLINYNFSMETKWLQTKQWEKLIPNAKQALVGKENRSVLNTNIREGMIIGFDDLKYNYSFEEELMNIILQNENFFIFSEFIGAKDKMYTSFFLGRDKVLLYQVGGHFEAHRDVQKTEYDYNKKSIATVIVSPPNLNYEGGELILYPREGEEVVVNFSKAKQWSYCIFNHNILHKANPVTKGIKVILKYNLFPFTEIERSFVTEIPKIPSQHSYGEILAVELKTLEEKLAKKKADIENYNKFNFEKLSKVEKVFDFIENHIQSKIKIPCLIALEKQYQNADPEQLLGLDNIIFRECFRRYKGVQIVRFTAEYSKEFNGWRFIDQFREEDPQRIDSVFAIYGDLVTGATSISSTEQYNDEYYYTVEKYSLLAIAIPVQGSPKWSINTHKYFPHVEKQVVLTLMLSRSRQSCVVSCLPKVILFLIIQQIL